MGNVLSFSPGLAKKARTLFDQGDFQEAARFFHRVLLINPRSLSGWFGKAIANQEMGIYRKAIHCYQQVFKEDPTDLGAWNNSAICYWELGYQKAAIRRYKKAIQIQIEKKTQQHQSFINLIESYLEIGAFKDALLVVDSWMQAFPQSPEARWMRADILSYCGTMGVVPLRTRTGFRI